MNYQEWVLEVPDALRGRGAAERAALLHLAPHFGWLCRSQRVPFHKPIAAYCSTSQHPTWRGLSAYVAEANKAFDLQRAQERRPRCAKHGHTYVRRVHNFTETFGCAYYPGGTCRKGATKYLSACLETLRQLKNALDVEVRQNLLHFVKDYGPNGCPDILAVATAAGTLSFIEVKRGAEGFSSDSQRRYLEWASTHGMVGVVLRVVGGAPAVVLRR